MVSILGNSGNFIIMRKQGYPILDVNQTIHWNWTIKHMLMRLFIWGMKLWGASCPTFRNFCTALLRSRSFKRERAAGRLLLEQAPCPRDDAAAWAAASSAKTRRGPTLPAPLMPPTEVLLMHPLDSIEKSWVGDNFKCQHYLFFYKNKPPKTLKNTKKRKR